jgi:hypothetical protein
MHHSSLFEGKYDFFILLYRSPEDPAPCFLDVPILCKDQCPCPPESIRNKFVSFTVDDNNTMCPPGHCYIEAFLNVPGAYECFTHYSVEGGPIDTLVRARTKIFSDCVPSGQALEITVMLYHGENDPRPCRIVDKSAPCQINCCDFIDVEFSRAPADGFDVNCRWKYSFEATDPACLVSTNDIEMIVYQDPQGLAEIPQEDNEFWFLTIPSNGILYYQLIIDGDTCNIRADTLICDCISCPGYDGYKDWFNLQSAPGACDSNECAIQHFINLDSAYYCYENFQVRRTIDDHILPLTPEQPIEALNGYLSQLDTCIKRGERYEVEIIMISHETLQHVDGRYTCPLIQSTVCPVIPDDSLTNNNPAPTCVPDCPEDEFEKGNTVVVFSDSCQQCLIYVSYEYRQACDSTYQDIQITEITRKPIDGAFEGACGGCTSKEVMQEAVFNLINKNPMDFKLPTVRGECDTSWRVVQASCWMTYHVYDFSPSGDKIFPIEVRTPCEPSCCVKPIQICRKVEGDGYDVENIPHRETVTTTCDPNATLRVVAPLDEFFIPENGGCRFSCDELDGLKDLSDEYDWTDGDTISFNGGGGPYLRSASSEQIDNEMHKHVEFRFVQDTEYLTVEFWNSNARTVTLSLYTLTGQLLTTQDESIEQGIASLRANLQPYASGTYIVNITVDGVMLRSGVIQIVK